MPPSPDSSRQTAQVQALFITYAATLRGFVVSLLPEFGMADDVLHETFLTVTEKAAEFELGTNFLAWAKTIARYKVFAARRAHWRESPGWSEASLEAICAAEPEADLPVFEQQLAALAGCIAELPPVSRRAVELRYKQAHPIREVSRLLGYTPDNLYVLLCRVRQLLRECVERKLAGNAH